MPYRAHSKGFTLIELSIVLVIIGLIVGGVLVGQDLIRASEIRSTIKKIESYDAAVNTFRTKYNCIPGDCPTVATFGFTFPGSGDTLIAYSALGFGSEYLNIWLHLSSASLIDGRYTGQGGPVDTAFPRMPTDQAYATLVTISAVDATPTGSFFNTVSAPLLQAMPRNYYYLLVGAFLDNDTSGMAVFRPATAYTIDSKLDDGLPLSGRIWAAGNDIIDLVSLSEPTVGAGGAASNFCVSNSVTPNAYNSANNSGATASKCSLLIRASF